MSEGLLVTIIGVVCTVAGAIFRDVIDRFLNRGKDKVDEIGKYAHMASELTESLRTSQALVDDLLDRDKEREKERADEKKIFEDQIATSTKAFDRINKDFRELREEKRVSDETHLEMLRIKNGEVLVQSQEIKELKKQAAQWQAQAKGLQALQNDVSNLKITTDKLTLQQDSPVYSTENAERNVQGSQQEGSS